MSRFGRDYLQVGTYMEVLRKHDTRLIALNDSVDTLKGDDEFTPCFARFTYLYAIMRNF